MVHSRKKDKLIILGMVNTWKEAPIPTGEYDVWAMNSSWLLFENAIKESEIEYDPLDYITLWWEIHTLETRSEDHQDWLKNKTNTIPVMMQKHYDEVPHSIEYPINEVVAYFDRRYFLCTMNYQIAWAIMLGYKEISMYGFSMLMSDDLIQKWSVEYWLGRAESSCIKIVLPESCDLLKSPSLYGYEAVNTVGVWMQRYINAKKSSVLTRVSESTSILRNLVIDMLIAHNDLDIIFRDSQRFMKEIYARHGLYPLENGKWEGEDF